MTRYIHADRMLQEIHRLLRKYHGNQIAYDVLRCLERMCNRLANDPDNGVMGVDAKWYEKDEFFHCSACGHSAPRKLTSEMQVKTKYCPFCGAKMCNAEERKER